MYGIVNKAIEDLITTNYGRDTWQSIKKRCDVDIDYFISTEPYDDDITYKLAAAAAEELNITVNQVLFSFGEWWILKTSKEKYGSLIESGGNHFREFMINLPSFHNRVMLIYPKLTPPEFKISDLEDNRLKLHYHSSRKGLTEFVHGLISGIGKLYETPVSIQLLESKSETKTHDIFEISW